MDIMDQTKFLNTYIDVILNTTHEQINSIVQLKTNLRLAEESVNELRNIIEIIEKEKKEIIERVNTEIVLNADKEEVIKKLYERIDILSGEVDGYKQKASHIDAFAQQIVILKNELAKYQKPQIEKKTPKKPTQEDKDDF